MKPVIIYINNTWLAKKTKFQKIISEEGSWRFTKRQLNSKKIDISAYLRKGKGMLALPHGVHQVSNLMVLSLQHNELGAVKVKQGPQFIKYTAHFAQKTPLDIPPTKHDLFIPKNERVYLTELSNNLGLPNQTPQQVLNILTKFFHQNFQYSLKPTTPIDNITPIENFLRNRRAGHCEYFATTTSLLLRVAGIPSRYAVGYAVQEFSPLENVFVVRKRHAHAWTLAYIDDHWIEFDTTPASWVSIEDKQAAWWEPINDFWSFLNYQFSKWRWRETKSQSNDWLLWLIFPLSLILIWRLYSRRKVLRSQTTTETKVIVGADSAFYKIVQQINTAGYIRQPGETLTAWLKRIHKSDANIQMIFNMHQRYRFDPAGLNVKEQNQLKESVETWLHAKKH